MKILHKSTSAVTRPLEAAVYLPMAPTGCLTPISLFTVITETKLVSGWKAASSSWGIRFNQAEVVTHSRSKIPAHTFNLLADRNHQPPNQCVTSKPPGC